MKTKTAWKTKNIIWGLCGGWLFSLIWYAIGGLFYITYVGRPLAKYCFLIARFAGKPYGRVIGTTGDYSFIGNIFWMVLIGFPWIILFMFVAGLFCLTLIGVPIGVTYLRLAGLVACPIGMQLEKQLERW